MVRNGWRLIRGATILAKDMLERIASSHQSGRRDWLPAAEQEGNSTALKSRPARGSENGRRRTGIRARTMTADSDGLRRGLDELRVNLAKNVRPFAEAAVPPSDLSDMAFFSYFASGRCRG